MKQPTTPEELQELHDLLRTDPQEYLREVNRWIDDNPLDPVFPGPFEPAIPNVPKLGPFPSEVMPPPIAIPNAFPRELPINPYPDRPECEEEWAAATKYCFGLVNRGLLGKDGHRGFGKSLSQCIMGQVSQECGGNVIQS